MKIYFLLAGLAGLLGLGAVVYFTNNEGTGTPVSTITANATTLKTDLFVQPNEGVERKAAGKETVVGGDLLRTSSTGRALVEKNDGTTTVLDYDTTFTLTGDETHTTGVLSGGAVWARVEKLFGQGEYYEIETSNAVAVVRGTSFGVLLSGGVSSIVVASGTVAVIPKDETTGRRRANDQVLVTADKKAVVSGGKVTVSPLSLADKNTEWFRFNNKDAVTPATTPKPTPTPTPSTSSVQPTPTPIAPTPVEAGPMIISVVPAKVTQGGVATIKGKGFLKVAAVIVGKDTLPPNAVRIVDDTNIEVNTTNISIGTWVVFVVDVNQRQASLQNALTVEARAPVQTTTIPGTASPNDPTGSKP